MKNNSITEYDFEHSQTGKHLGTFGNKEAVEKYFMDKVFEYTSKLSEAEQNRLNVIPGLREVLRLALDSYGKQYDPSIVEKMRTYSKGDS